MFLDLRIIWTTESYFHWLDVVARQYFFKLSISVLPNELSYNVSLWTLISP